MSNIETNPYDKVAREILDTGWFEDSKSDYNSMFFKHVTHSGELHVLDIGSHLGLWALRILEYSKNNNISTKMLCVDPCIDSTDSFESNTSEYSSLIEHFELAITDETENTLYIKHLEQNSLGSIQISPMIRNTIVDEMAVSGPPGPDLYPNEIVLGVAQTVTAQKIITEYSQNISPSSLNAVVCYACGYEYQILKSLQFLFSSSQPITYIFQLYDNTLQQCGSSLSEVLSYMESHGFNYEKTDLHYATSHNNQHLDHTYYTFYK